ncbi:hypothetical protein MPTK1_6g02140 [Marchantia polymorpha subsp. ruderalis]|uniref:Uncharacterized protein n=2 Tax=Marchantia polymorpha TaxID=3197 RepID=A0AAF6BMM9_MARPO|nr:hypothetical protein MARPO_0248s0002 [Marchantia polymorpha]BBN13263.1 hypothetical protein Mp_6g02140 [Marchantia polymorpha subsp. ruderalis]|eukprot:PTQ26985.1 hypothetical protein MARPO_0248s0002 [Marchantia polymorpha]
MVASPCQRILSHLVEEEEDGRRVRIYRLPIYIKDSSFEDFRPQELVVGFYTHRALVIDEDPMHLDNSKVAIAREFCRGPGPDGPPVASALERPINPQIWVEFGSSLEVDLKLARENYDRLSCDGDASSSSENAAVALDALFIVAYLRYNYSFHDTWGYDFRAVFERCAYNAQRFPLLRDLLMLENQVPISLLQAVVTRICRPTPASPSSQLYDMLQWFVMAIHPFSGEGGVGSVHLRRHFERFHQNSCDTFVKCDHLLHCSYLAICGPEDPLQSSPLDNSEYCGVELPYFSTPSKESWTPARTTFRIPSATSLLRMGISVEVGDGVVTTNGVRLKRRKGNWCLLLPQLTMNDDTASIFRNLALYEQIMDNGIRPRGDMRTYLVLMSSLLDSVQDVRLLINQGVILNQLGSSEKVSQQWNRMCDGLYIPSTSPAYWSDLHRILNQVELQNSTSMRPTRSCFLLSTCLVVIGCFLAFLAVFLRTVILIHAHPQAAM